MFANQLKTSQEIYISSFPKKQSRLYQFYGHNCPRCGKLGGYWAVQGTEEIICQISELVEFMLMLFSKRNDLDKMIEN